MASYDIRRVEEGDRGWVASFLTAHWGAPGIVAHGEVHRADLLPGFLAIEGDDRIGLLTFRIEGPTCEVVSLNSLRERSGIGTALLRAAVDEARRAGCRRFFLVTTNDNLRAIRFYRRLGLVLRSVHRDALDFSRRLKPSIGLVGLDGLALRHEVELDLVLSPQGSS